MKLGQWLDTRHESICLSYLEQIDAIRPHAFHTLLDCGQNNRTCGIDVLKYTPLRCSENFLRWR